MGKSDVKLQRFLSVPSNVALCERKECSAVLGIDKDPCDTDKIFVRQKSVIFQMKSTYSSGTDSEKLPLGLHFSVCTSDINTNCIKANEKLICNTFDSEMVGNMSTGRGARNRRTALGYIFQDTTMEDLDNLLSTYDNRTNNETSGSVPEGDRHHRRSALADIFQDLDEDELEHLLSLCEERDSHNEQDSDSEVTNLQRRPALPNIFANINEEQLLNFMEQCRHDIEEMESIEVKEIEMPSRCRRLARGNIFSGIEESDVQRISRAHERDSDCEEGTEQESLSCRRFALGDIFNGFSEKDLLRLMSVCETETEDEEFDAEDTETDRRTNISNRRFALADIFQDVNEDDLAEVLSDYCSDLDDNDSQEVNFPNTRRKALSYIFSDVNVSDLEELLSNCRKTADETLEKGEDTDD